MSRPIVRAATAIAVVAFWITIAVATGMWRAMRITVGEGKYNESFRIAFVVAFVALFTVFALIRRPVAGSMDLSSWARMAGDLVLGTLVGYLASLVAYATVLVTFRSRLILDWTASPASILQAAALLAGRFLWVLGSVSALTLNAIAIVHRRVAHANRARQQGLPD